MRVRLSRGPRVLPAEVSAPVTAFEESWSLVKSALRVDASRSTAHAMSGNAITMRLGRTYRAV
jgi:hypothetical protein